MSMSRCTKCGEDIRPDEDLLVLLEARATDNEGGFAREKDLAAIHRCCDDGLSLRMEADEDGWRSNREYACAHIRRKFDLGHWESRMDGAWVPCHGHHLIPECERIGPKRDSHRFVVTRTTNL